MSEYYHGKRTRGFYDPESSEHFRLSRSKIELFLECPKCFYLDRRLGVGRPPGFPFSLNNAVDELLKNEFDIYREKGEPHPLMKEAGIDAIPFKDERLPEWRNAKSGGVVYLQPGTNLLITGGIDDVWINPKGELIVADYKATSKAGEVSLDADWQISYKWQMEIYQWLFRRNGFKVNSTGYFVYCNGDAKKKAFNKKLEFDIKLVPHKGDDSWIEKAVLDMYKCLQSDSVPESGDDCDFCLYRDAVENVLREQ